MKAFSCIPDDDFGTLFLVRNARAGRMIYRLVDNGLRITLPPHVGVKTALDGLETLRERLKDRKVEKSLSTPFGFGYCIDTPFFRLTMEPAGGTRFLLSGHDAQYTIGCPRDTDFSSPRVKDMLRKAIATRLRKRAMEVLPQRVAEIARRYGWKYESVRITTAQTRWGSCDMRGRIMLSCYVLLLPIHLADYVIKHELAHLKEMNHSPAFWSVLDSMTDGYSKQLREELKQHRCEI